MRIGEKEIDGRLTGLLGEGDGILSSPSAGAERRSKVLDRGERGTSERWW